MMQLTCTKTKRMAEFDDTGVQCFKVTDKHQLPQSVFPRIQADEPLEAAIAWVYRGDLSQLTPSKEDAMENSKWNYWYNRAKAAEQNLLSMQVMPPLSLDQIRQAALTNEAAFNAALGYYEKWGKQSPAKR